MAKRKDRHNGVLLVDKPEGWRSRQVVDAVGKAFRVRKIGHAGTLDPAASGLLVLLLGEGTKLSRFLMDGRKVYRARIRLGQETDTYDRDGEIVAEADASGLGADEIRDVLAAYRGTILQDPPMYAAIKVAGEPLYKYARRGEQVDVEPREVTIHSLKAVSVDPPDVEIEVTCSKGTYIRSIAHDVGRDLGVGGHLSSIRRIESVPYHVREARRLDDLLEMTEEEFADAVVPLVDAMPNVPLIEADEGLERAVANGNAMDGDLLYGRLPDNAEPGDLIQIRTPARLAVCEVARAPAELGPPPWRGREPLRYARILHLDPTRAD